jgi:predicted NUDIX family NTP pyrophosphohydrolase
MKQSAGILLYRLSEGGPQFFLVHPGGPFWKNKDEGAWSIPKGEYADNEEPLKAAVREFGEETGVRPEAEKSAFRELSPVRLKSGKRVSAWALELDIDASAVKSNEFEMEWPPRSGRTIMVPEIDKAGWFAENEALEKINQAQRSFILEMLEMLG